VRREDRQEVDGESSPRPWKKVELPPGAMMMFKSAGGSIGFSNPDNALLTILHSDVTVKFEAGVFAILVATLPFAEQQEIAAKLREMTKGRS
jgi:hypothetical protein